MVMNGKNFEITWWMHGICWGWPLFLTFLPYINATYAAPDGTGWCFVVPNDDAPEWATSFWYWFGRCISYCIYISHMHVYADSYMIQATIISKDISIAF
jgi:hypothetical protein